VQDLWDRGRGAMWDLMEAHFQTPAHRSATIDDHRAIYLALDAHDPREARNAMRSHLKRVDSEFARGWQLLKRPSADQPRQTGGRRAPGKKSKGGG